MSAQNSVEGLGPKSQGAVDRWTTYVRGGFAPFPVVFDSAEGHIITDVDGKKYIDFISQFAVLNFGHSHPKIVKAAVEQMQKLPLVNTSYINPLYAQLAERLTKKYGYDRVTAMCSGSEAADSAIKIARKWAYVKKGVPVDKAVILTADFCYHGITLATMSLSNVMIANFGEHLPNVGPFAPKSGKLVKFGKLDVLEEALRESGEVIAAFMIEPIQGLAGTRVPPKGYLKGVRNLCTKYNVLFIADEVQAGFGRTGMDFSYLHEPECSPDMVNMGKAITGGLYPMSVIMGKSHVLDVLEKYEIAGTFGAAPPACAAALAVLDVMEEEKISERSMRLGKVFQDAIDKANLPYILEHRGRDHGLFQTLVVDHSVQGVTARRIVALCALRGLLCGFGANRIRFSPPLVISEEDVLRAVDILASAFRDVASLGDFPGSDFLN